MDDPMAHFRLRNIHATSCPARRKASLTRGSDMRRHTWHSGRPAAAAACAPRPSSKPQPSGVLLHSLVPGTAGGGGVMWMVLPRHRGTTHVIVSSSGWVWGKGVVLDVDAVLQLEELDGVRDLAVEVNALEVAFVVEGVVAEEDEYVNAPQAGLRTTDLKLSVWHVKVDSCACTASSPRDLLCSKRASNRRLMLPHSSRRLSEYKACMGIVCLIPSALET